MKGFTWGILVALLTLSFVLPSVLGDVCSDFINTNETACEEAVNGTCTWFTGSHCPESVGCCGPQDCWDFNNQTACEEKQELLGCFFEDGKCRKLDCFSADDTNQTYCETTLNATYGLECEYEAGSGFCDPIGGHGGSGCFAFDNNSAGCLQTGFCEWDEGTQECELPEGGFIFNNPGCDFLGTEVLCGEASGCSWDGSSCTGKPIIECEDLQNKTFCNEVPFLSSCCSYNGTNCTTSVTQNCWENLQEPPTGAKFCEDFNAFDNQTLCEQIAGTPWYMPCAWDNESNECGFAGGDHFDGGFDDIKSKATCEAAGGTWRTETYNEGGKVKKDEWCEFSVGDGGNCDVSCWACEKQNDGSEWANEAAAQSACEGSATGFCQFYSDSNALNGYGWCDPVEHFNFGGGDCDSNCRDCTFLNTAEVSCNASLANCKWVTDPSDSTNAWCEKKSAKTCSNDCFSCYEEDDCETYGKGGSGACTWDDTGYFCKPSDFSGEVCFDGIDNDGNGFIDCNDPACGFDTFCGGNFLGDCGQYDDNASCVAGTTPFGNCVFITDDFGSFCGMPGEQCFEFDRNETQCNATSGCGFLTGEGDGFCEINITQEDSCYEADDNATACGLLTGCKFVPDPQGGGFCEHEQEECFWNVSLRTSQSACQSNANCAWIVDDHFGQATCMPKCYSFDGNATACNADSSCELVAGLCEPTAFIGGCYEFDNTNQTACEESGACHWETPICISAVSHAMFQDMDRGPPVVLAEDGFDNNLSNEIDILGFGMKDMGSSFGIGSKVVDFSGSALCYNNPLQEGGTGRGRNTTKFYWYMDSDGSSSVGCNATGVNGTFEGFEFRFTLEGVFNTEDTTSTQKRVAHRCLNDTWAPTPIPLSADSFRMCGDIGGGMVAFEKESAEKFRSLYNSTANFRFFATSANGSTGVDSPLDQAGPGFFTPGTVDFSFEDCMAKGQDFDGDGLTAENDPDCAQFFKFGFKPNEVGPQCGDGIDNDNDGDTDCNDAGCKNDAFFCGGSFVADENDHVAPKVIWLEREEFVDAALIKFDTDEPSNGTVLYYHQDSSCLTLNSTLLDIGLLDSFISTYKVWHDVALDNFAFNPQPLGFSLSANSSYYFKVNNCDVSGNCAQSKCLNFTTKASFDDCTSCRATVDFDFTPPPGAVVADPLGNVRFRIGLASGQILTLNTTAVSINYTDAGNASLLIDNPNSTKAWLFVLEQIKLKKLSESIKSLNGSTLKFNETSEDDFLGFDADLCQTMVNELRPKKLQLCLPGNQTELWHCDDDFDTCVNRTSAASLLGYNDTLNYTCWRTPSEWGC